MLKLGNFLKCKQTRMKAIKAKEKEQNDEATGTHDERSGDTNNLRIDRSVETNNRLAEPIETIERSIGDARRSTSPKRYSANIAYPFNDVKATSFPPPPSNDASILTEVAKNARRITEEDYRTSPRTTPRTSVLFPERTSIYSKRKSSDRGDQLEAIETLKKSDQLDEKDRSSKDLPEDMCTRETCRSGGSKVCTLSTCVGPSTHKNPYADEIYPTKLTDMINSSIKEAMQTIVKDCSIIPTVQENSKLTPSVSKDIEKSHETVTRSICQNVQQVPTKSKNSVEPRAVKEQCHCVTSAVNRDNAVQSHNSSRYNRAIRPCRVESPWGLTSMKVLTTNDNDAGKKCKRHPSKSVKTDNRRDNRRMTGNVNIYICSEANEGTQVTKKKKPKTPPCSASGSETATEQSTATCVRSASAVSSKLVNNIRKKRQMLQDQEPRNLSYSQEKSDSHCNTDESSNSDSCTTKYRNCRLVAERDSNDTDDACETVCSQLDCRNSVLTSSTRDGCCCKDTVVSGTDLLVKQSQSSFPRSRFTACVKEKLIPGSTFYPTKDVPRCDNWIERSIFDSKQRPRKFDCPRNLLQADPDTSHNINNVLLRSVSADPKNVNDRRQACGNHFDARRQLRSVNEICRKSNNVCSPRNVSGDNCNGMRERVIGGRERQNSYVTDNCKCRCQEFRGSINNYGNECKAATRWRKVERHSFDTSKESIQRWSTCNCIAEEEEDYCSDGKKLEDRVEKETPEKMLYVKTFDDTDLYPEKNNEPAKILTNRIDGDGKKENVIDSPAKDIVENSEVNESRSNQISEKPLQKEKFNKDPKKGGVLGDLLKERILRNDRKKEEEQTTENLIKQSESNLNDNPTPVADDAKVEASPNDKSQNNPNPLKIVPKPKIRAVLSAKTIDIKNKFLPKPTAPIVEQSAAAEKGTKPQATFKRPTLVPPRVVPTKSPEINFSKDTKDQESVAKSAKKYVTTETPVTANEKLTESFPLRCLKKAFGLIKHRKIEPATKTNDSPQIVDGGAIKDNVELVKTGSTASSKVESKSWGSTNDESEITKFANKGHDANKTLKSPREVSVHADPNTARAEAEKPVMEQDTLEGAGKEKRIKKDTAENKLKLPRAKLRDVIESAKKTPGLKAVADKLFPQETTVPTEIASEPKSESKGTNDEESIPEAKDVKRDTLIYKPQSANREPEKETEKEQEEVGKVSQYRKAERRASINNNVEGSRERPSRTPTPSYDYCYQPKIEYQCETPRHSTYCIRPSRPVPCNVPARENNSLAMHPCYAEYCSLQKESNNSTIVPCISYRSTQNDCRCNRPVGCVCRCRAKEECSCSGPTDAVGRRLRSKDDSKCKRSMICIYCENPREHCTCRPPIRKCSPCSLPLDICNCREALEEEDDAVRRKDLYAGRPIMVDSSCDNGNTMCVTAWRPNRDVRRYFARSEEDVLPECQDEYCCRQKLKPYGSDELPYQRFSAFSDVMNELQQKISGSMSCACCRKVPCCCNLGIDRGEEMEERKMQSSPRACRRAEQLPTSCKCGVSPPRCSQRRTAPMSRTCRTCNLTPCKCRKNRISQRKPRAKCYYCKSLPCTCIGTRETCKPRPCRCADSPGRLREKEIVPCGNPIGDPKDNDAKLVCVRDSNTRVCSAPKRHQRHDNPVKMSQPEEKCR